MKFGIGQPVRRKEDVRFVTGQGRYLDDIQIDNAAFTFFVRSPHAHAIIRGVDATAARAAAGVIGVLTAADLPDTGFVPVRGAFKSRDGSLMKQSPKMLLPADKVRFAGEAVAMVVAETPALAKDAAELVVVDYEPLGAAGTLETAPNAPPVWDDAPGNLAFDWADGNESACASAFAGAARTVSVALVQNRVVPNPMEPRGGIGLYDPASDRYTLYTSTQGSSGIRDKLAGPVLKIPPEKLRVITPDVGGGFGMKNSVAVELALILIATKAFLRPVKWVGERMEAFLADGHGRDVKMTGELALDADARILALRVTSAANLGAYMTHVGPHIPTTGLRVMGGVYRVPIVYAHVKGYFTNTTTVTSYRGAGRPEAIYVTERLLDAAAEAFGIDRREIRRRNLIAKNELPYRNWKGLSIDSGDFIANLEEATRRADWDGFAARRRLSEAHGKRRGRGISYYFEASGGPPGAEPSKIRFTENGAVEVYLATQSNGQGHETTFAQLVSDRLGVPFESVIVKQGDTDYGVSGGGTVGSRSLQTAGNAITLTVESIVKKGKVAAGQVLQADTAAVAFEVAEGTGRFFVTGTSRSISVTELAVKLKREHLPGFEDGLNDAGSFESPPTFPNGCHVCEVEVDPDTGTVAIAQYVVVDDVGTVINPLIVDGQIHGGVAQGLGQALMENCVYDPDSGQLMTATFVDYVMPRADDMPNLDISYNEIPCTTNPLGAKGAGEAGTIGSLPAIIGAISDALNVTHIDMPATPEKVWRAAQASFG
ncbi:MAG TPA: xanthine dehydrogenase family protein molybdopterin-binding subunit [Micropepsaceae bacterium]|nr:xanthine dehydrogenase family protein molybdopterin-binding subunit [Micropepsaceae bacterium]